MFNFLFSLEGTSVSNKKMAGWKKNQVKNKITYKCLGWHDMDRIWTSYLFQHLNLDPHTLKVENMNCTGIKLSTRVFLSAQDLKHHGSYVGMQVFHRKFKTEDMSLSVLWHSLWQAPIEGPVRVSHAFPPSPHPPSPPSPSMPANHVLAALLSPPRHLSHPPLPFLAV